MIKTYPEGVLQRRLADCIGARGMVLAGYCPVLNENWRPLLPDPSSSFRAKTKPYSTCSLSRQYLEQKIRSVQIKIIYFRNFFSLNTRFI